MADAELQEMIDKSIENPSEAELTYTVVEGKLAMRALGTRVIVVEDRFKTGHECKGCDGEGILHEECPHCHGDKYIARGDSEEDALPCPTCRIDGRPTGNKLCPSCDGRGALIVIPQTAERRPTSGIVTSTGHKVEFIKKGDHVLYSNMSGTAINFKQKNVIRILHEDEIMAVLYSVSEFNLGAATR